MTRISVHITDQDGACHVIEAAQGQSLMQAIKSAGLDLPAICGGSCTCATCHIYVDADWFERLDPAGEEERELLDEEAHLPLDNSRLSCQIEIGERLNGISVTLPPLD